MLLHGPTGGFVLVDAGGAAAGHFDAGERVVAPFLSRRGCRRIEVLLLSHGHEDHAGGVAAILRDFEVGELWIPPGSLHERLVRHLAALAVENGSAVRLVERGFASVHAGIDLRVLHPGPADRLLSENDRSAVLLARVGERKLLVPGDLESAGEESLLAAPDDLHADVLVVAHHGAARSSMARFLDAVRPRTRSCRSGRGTASVTRTRRPSRGWVREGPRSIERIGTEGCCSAARPTAGRWSPESEHADRNRNEGQQEEHEEHDGEDHPAGSEPARLVEKSRMAIPHVERDGEPDQVHRHRARRVDLVAHESDETEDRRVREDAVQPPRHRIGRVSAVELTDREEVERRHEHPHPSRPQERVEAKLEVAVRPALDDVRHERGSELEALRSRLRLEGRRPEDSGQEHRECDGESRERTCRGHVEGAFRLRIAPRIRMTAPKVPSRKGGGAGRKNGRVAGIP